MMDHNLIVEEYGLYQELTPKMQTELIEKVFGRFLEKFHYFFDPCEVGFRNEFVIQLYARIHKPGAVIQPYGRKPDEMVMIMD